MTKDINLQFITERINEVRSAIMYSLSDDLIRLPNSIVTAVKVDEEGQLWFICDKPNYLPEEFPQPFPVRLHFYRKGKLFNMEVSGAAKIANGLGNENGEFGKRLLIQMDMKNITYRETEINKKNHVSSSLSRSWQWLLRQVGIHPDEKPVLHPLPASHS